ncbi:MAG: type II secretion system protein GspD, partial [Chthoniobacterales bacterium]
SVIRSLVKIIDQVDIPPAEVVSEFIKLERADASKVVDMLKDVFEKGNQPGGPGPGGVRNVRGIPAPPVPGAQGANSFEVNDNGLTALTEDSIVVGKIKIAADVRTNRIHVITRPVNMPFIKKLISEFDANVDFATPVTRPLRYISAATVLPVIVQTLTEAGSEGGAGGNPPGLGQNSNQPPNQNRNNPNNFNNSANNNNLNGSGSGGGGQSFSEELSTQAVDTTPQAVTIGNSKIIADPRANTIIILGNREVVVKVMKLLDEMDVSAPQVALSTVIGELRLSNNEEFGVDFFQNFTKFDPSNPGGRGGAAGFARNTGAPLFSASDLRNFTQLAAAASTGGASVFITGALGLSTIVHALDSTGRFKTISRPTIFTSNNKKAIIASGTEIPVPVSTLSQPLLTGQNVSQQSNIQFKKIALQLEVVPLINSQKEVTLDILQKLDSVDGFTQVDNNQIPNIATRYIKTTVSAPNCATIALGGLITDSVSRNTSGIPILSRIPLVGGIFRNTAKPKERRELIILMRPEVSLTKLEAERLRHKAEDRTHFGPELNQDDCPDCPKPADASKDLTPPDLPDLPAPK